MNPTSTTGTVGKQAAKAVPSKWGAQNQGAQKSSTDKSRSERAGGRSAGHGADTHVPGWVAFVGAGPVGPGPLPVGDGGRIGRASLGNCVMSVSAASGQPSPHRANDR